MFRDAIPNEILDIPRKPALPIKKDAPTTFSLDYANSDDPGEIDSGIRDTIRGIRFSILAMGVGLAKIKRKGLYLDLKYHSMNDYIEKLADDTHMDRSSIFNWMYIGEAFTNYRNDLDKISFTDEDGPTKLLYVDRALAVHTKPEVFGNIKTMSFRKFKDFALVTPAKEKNQILKVSVEIEGDKIMVNGQNILNIPDTVPASVRESVTRDLAETFRIRASGNEPFIVETYGRGEQRAIDTFLKKHRAKR